MVNVKLDGRLVHTITKDGQENFGPPPDRVTECYIYMASDGTICVERRDFKIAAKKGLSISLYAVKRSGWEVEDKGFIADYLYT